MRPLLFAAASVCVVVPAWAQQPAPSAAPPLIAEAAPQQTGPAFADLDLGRLDRYWAELDQQRQRSGPAERERLGQALGALLERREAFSVRYGNVGSGPADAADRQAMLRDYDALAADVLRARFNEANREAFTARVDEVLARSREGIAEVRARFDQASPDQRAELAVQLIALRREYDGLIARALTVRRASGAEFQAQRDALTADIVRHDRAVDRAALVAVVPQ